MKAVIWFRITALLMFLFAALHTYGFLTFRPPTAEGLAVWDAMNRVHFSVGSQTFSFAHFYIAFGLSITAAQLFAVWLAWTLGQMAKLGAPGVQAIAWAMFAWQLAGIVISLVLIAATPAIFSAVAAVCIGMAAISARPAAAVA